MPLNIAETEDVTAALEAAKTYADVLVAGLEPAEPYDDGPLTARVVALETAPDPEGYNDAPILAAVNTLSTAHAAVSDRVSALEAEPDPQPYDDAPLKARVSALEAEPDPEPYDDSELAASVSSLDSRLQAVETAPPGTYNDTELRSRIEVLEARPIGGSGGTSYQWAVNLSTFAGSTDDAKLAAALTYAKAQTFKPTIVFDLAKSYTLNAYAGSVFPGLSLSGNPFRSTDQTRSSGLNKTVSNEVRIRTTGPLFGMPAGDTFGVSIANLAFDGNLGAALIGGGSGVAWKWNLHNLSAQNFGSFIGTTSSKWLNTACTFSGDWDLNNIQSRGWVVGGSDTNWAFTKCQIDSPTTLLGPTQYLVEFQSQSKGNIENLYVTAEGHAFARWTGGADRTIVAKSRIEGRNAGAPSPGALVRVEGSDVTFRDCWLSYAMSNPTATGRNDAGVVHVTGGNVLLDGIDYERATGVAESVPVLYASGGKVRVRNVNGRGFTGKPVVRQSVAGLINADDSVTVVTG